MFWVCVCRICKLCGIGVGVETCLMVKINIKMYNEDRKKTYASSSRDDKSISSPSYNIFTPCGSFIYT